MNADHERFLSRVRHDVVKRMLWAARDRRDAGGAVIPGELLAEILDDEGNRVTAAERFGQLCEEAEPVPAAARGRFEQALASAEAAARADDLGGVLALDDAFAELARDMKKGNGHA